MGRSTWETRNGLAVRKYQCGGHGKGQVTALDNG